MADYLEFSIDETLIEFLESLGDINEKNLKRIFKGVVDPNYLQRLEKKNNAN